MGGILIAGRVQTNHEYKKKPSSGFAAICATMTTPP
jgi:hypothetical protein